MLLLVGILIALPDVTQLRPERLLGKAELTFDGGFAGAFSGTTKTPTGSAENQPYNEVTMRAKVGVGMTNFLKAELTLPLFDQVQAPQDGLSYLRFGDPTLGLAGGGRILIDENSQLHLAPFAELTFPTTRQVVLRPRGAFVSPTDRGLVVATGGVSGVLGAMGAWIWTGSNAEVRLSLRGFYRVRSADASNGAGVDARVWTVLLQRLVLGARVDALVPFLGGARSMISPSRLADASGWVDATIAAGVRIIPMLDLVAAFSGPVYVTAGAYPLAAQVLLSYAYAAM